MIPIAFWDASVLVPLCVDQPPFTRISKALVPIYSMNVWWKTYVEIVGALTRLRRAGALSAVEIVEAKAELDRMALRWFVMDPSEQVKARASEVLEKYPLRAADGLQLAAALERCENRPAERSFLKPIGDWLRLRSKLVLHWSPV